MARSTTDLIRDRGKTHGDFTENAEISQDLKDLFRSRNGWQNLNPRERESLDQIAMKISRILSGKPVPDHWEDIAGYAHLNLK